MSKSISIELPPDVAEALDAMAAETERSDMSLILEAIEEYLADYADNVIALKRWRDETDPAISAQELLESLDASD